MRGAPPFSFSRPTAAAALSPISFPLSSSQGPLGLLVTGASSGIGRAIAIAAARAGADVALTYAHNESGARETARIVSAAGRRAAVFHLDLGDAAGLERSLAVLGDAAEAAVGRIDAWVNSAGADILTGDGAQLSDEVKLDQLISVDLRGTILASWRAAALLGASERGGVIINMSWDHAFSGMAGRNPQLFAAVKGGVQAFSASLARSVAPRVRVNVVAPGWIETAFADALGPERRSAIAATTPLQRWGTPDDVAAAVVYLASPAAAFITGQTILVNGGVVMG